MNDCKKTVIYTVKIIDANRGAWYATKLRHFYDCILDTNNDNMFSGSEICFRVLNAYHPVKWIKQQHCIIKKQRIATHAETVKLY